MAAILYTDSINGVGNFATLINAATPDATAGNTSGTIELSSGNHNLRAKQVESVLFDIVYVDGDSDRTALVITFETSPDGTNWFLADTINISSALASFSLAYVLQPLVAADNHVRVQVAVSGGTASGTSTITVKARLGGVFRVTS